MYLYCSIVRRTQSPANVLASDYEIYMVCPLVATVYWHKSLQFVKKISHNTLSLFGCYFSISQCISNPFFPTHPLPSPHPNFSSASGPLFIDLDPFLTKYYIRFKFIYFIRNSLWSFEIFNTKFRGPPHGV